MCIRMVIFPYLPRITPLVRLLTRFHLQQSTQWILQLCGEVWDLPALELDHARVTGVVAPQELQEMLKRT